MKGEWHSLNNQHPRNTFWKQQLGQCSVTDTIVCTPIQIQACVLRDILRRVLSESY